MDKSSDNRVERLQSAVNELSVLNEIALAINSTMSVDRITSTILDRCISHTGAAQGAIFLTGDEEPNAFTTFIRSQSENDTSTPFHLNLSIVGWMLLNKKIVHIDEGHEDETFPGLELNKASISSLVAAPLLSHDVVIGVLALFKRSHMTFSENDTRFLEIVCSQCTQVLENAKLHEKEESLHLLREELKIARRIQQKFLPDIDTLSFTDTICGCNSPAQEVGGDLFDIVELDEDNIFLSIADVSGKGIPASLLMSNAQAAMRAQLHSYPSVSLSKMISNLNTLLHQFTLPEQFLTGIFGIYNASRQEFLFVNAGHPPPIISTPEGQTTWDELPDLLLGVNPAAPYTERTIKLSEDAMLLLVTDGVTEAFNEHLEDFGHDRLQLFADKHIKFSAREVCLRMLDELARFRGTASQSDDITCVAVVNPSSGKSIKKS